MTPSPVPNAAVASPTASSCDRSPATATTVFDGRYIVCQKSRIVCVGSPRMPGLVAADLAAQRPVAEQRLLDEHLRVLGRVVEVGADLLDDHRPLLVDVLVLEPRPDDELAEDAHRGRRLAARDAHPVDGRLAVGRRVRRAADALDRLADGAARGVARGALEREVLHEVGDARLGGLLEPGAGEHVRGDRHGPRAGQARGDHARPIVEHGPVEHRG